MSALVQLLQQEARHLLESGTVRCFIGHEAGNHPFRAVPSFCTTAADVEKLVWGPFCPIPLSKYLLEQLEVDPQAKVALAAKPCDTRAVVRLINDNRIKREQVVIVGLPCFGVADAAAAALPTLPWATRVESAWVGANLQLVWPGGQKSISRNDVLPARCQGCTKTHPIAVDVLLDTDKDSVAMEVAATAEFRTNTDDVAPAETVNHYADVAQVEALSTAERRQFWLAQFSKCIRCYACRHVCPACSCKECCFDATDTRWLGKSTSVAENEVYHLTRAFHVAGRCTGCGECARVCPVGIPLGLLNKKVAQDLNDLFGAQSAGTALGEVVPLRTYRADDPDEFM